MDSPPSGEARISPPTAIGNTEWVKEIVDFLKSARFEDKSAYRLFATCRFEDDKSSKFDLCRPFIEIGKQLKALCMKIRSRDSSISV